eukprot:COSAG02_NODE_40753_length_401_cov_27.807947_1_plen_80_part_01
MGPASEPSSETRSEESFDPPVSLGGSKDSSDSCYDGVMGVCSDAMALIDCTEAGQQVFAAVQFGEHGEHAAKWRGRVALC